MSLVCEGVVKRHGSGFQLGPVSLTFTTGVTCLVGANGAGKSTLFGLVARVDRPNSGTVALPGRAVGYLPQSPEFPRTASCEEFLRYVAWVHRIPAHRRGARVDHVLAATGLLERRSHRIGALSGGMLRRLGIAQALVHEPGVLLLDEPTAGLDPLQRIALRDVVQSVAEGCVVIVSTHLVEDVRALARSVVLLNAGSVVFEGSVSALEELADPAAPGENDLEKAAAALMGAQHAEAGRRQ
jgi:ABC-2 type transport system ATP-binding protein